MIEALSWLGAGAMLGAAGLGAYYMVGVLLGLIHARRVRREEGERAKRMEAEAYRRASRGFAVALLAVLVMGQSGGSCKGSICATGEVFTGQVTPEGKPVCVCKPDHVKDDDGVGCRRV